MNLPFFLFLLITQSFAYASDIVYSRNARTDEAYQSSLMMKSIAHACLSSRLLSDALPCSPSMNLNKDQFAFQGQISSGNASITEIRNLLNGQVDDKIAEYLFSDGRIIQFDSSLDIYFSSDFINASIIPFSIKSFSAIRNEANPEVDFLAIDETGMVLQKVLIDQESISIGLQARVFERKFIKDRFQLFEAISSDKSFFSPSSQKVFYLEPALSYSLENMNNSRFTILVKNLGYKSAKFDQLAEPTEFQFGYSVMPEISWGQLEILLDIKSITFDEQDLEKLHFGSIYQFGSMSLSGGLDSRGLSAGIFVDVNQINSGLLYTTTKLTNSNEEFYTQTIYAQFGWKL